MARYCGSQPLNGEAEVGIVMEDAYQGQGIGWQLLDRLAAYARGRGLHILVATVATHNTGVRAMIRRSGYAAEYTDIGCGEYQVSVSLKGRAPLNGHAQPAGGGIFAALRRYFR